MNPAELVRAIRAQRASHDDSNNQNAVAGLMAYKLAQHRDQLVAPASAVASGSQSKRDTVPPVGCPMHQEASGSAQARPSSPPTRPKMVAVPASPGQCPIPHEDRDAYLAARSSRQASAEDSGVSSEPSFSTGPARQASSKPWSSTLNPLNMMPSFSQTPTAEQKSSLSTERVVSSIPRARTSPAPGASPYDAASACPVQHGESGEGGQTEKWEYPSAQQFYNALVRKGWETPEEHVETMVLVHNFLNEQAWLEVLDWERLAGADAARAELARFQGKPGTLTPKARFFGLLATLMPATFSAEPPFDRHDWIVRRPDQNGREVRYVIDYYSVPDDPNKDEPEFVLDVRPALDSFESLRVRLRKAYDEWQGGQGFFATVASEPKPSHAS